LEVTGDFENKYSEWDRLERDQLKELREQEEEETPAILLSIYKKVVTGRNIEYIGSGASAKKATKLITDILNQLVNVIKRMFSGDLEDDLNFSS
jgi:hypothetical protein